MPGEDTLAQHKSSESVTDADVQRLLNIALAGAGVVEGPTPRTQCRYGESNILESFSDQVINVENLSAQDVVEIFVGV